MDAAYSDLYPPVMASCNVLFGKFPMTPNTNPDPLRQVRPERSSSTRCSLRHELHTATLVAEAGRGLLSDAGPCHLGVIDARMLPGAPNLSSGKES